MNLQCKKCKSTNTKVMSAEKLSEETGDNNFNTAAAGVASVAILPIIEKLLDVLGKLFGFLEEKEKNKKQILVCLDCGYWEKL